ncbi:P-loop containing nucleoside triphosphate hydrolase protein [Glomus cerebriforme]|uniref:P-loop containing nucleoside triphosphate hydrolase protein n=1 Tax=Glomus cerebriforme TaxID=658196 RepID=A0A397SE51_9GLOM|nr:P-loop containing nucleoside triphosphate hydrolase protein [Glomus cerebriforme]
MNNIQHSIQEPDPFKLERDNGDAFVRLINPGLIETLRRYLQAESLYERNPKLAIYELFFALPELRNAIGRDPGQKNDKSEFFDYDDDFVSQNDNKSHLESLVDLIEVEYESRIGNIKEMIENNVISFKNLFYLFTKGQHVRAEWNECIIGAKVTRVTYHHSYFGEYMNIITEIIDSDGITFIHGTKSFIIDDWKGVCEIEKLPVVPLPEESPIRDELITRGRKFVKYAIGPHYLHYTGNMFYKSWYGTTNYKSDGRVMIDTVSFSKINPTYNMETTKRANRQNDFGTQKSVKEEELFMCAPSLYGFCFATKKWGQLFVDPLDELTFDDNAFDQLVMDPIKKELISSLVTSKHEGSDFISGKGGSCIFLLYGPPGVGKTLTAEATSEFLHRPLYAVNVGELGTSVVDLERKLSEILEVASIWNAVILIDEADIFLERRSENDIQRNALVGVFLRLLEYHQGILFLTTNRVKCFEPAFQSRISVALKYDDLDTNAREQIWRTFLDRIEGKNKSQVNIEELKRRSLNGREIKTAVKLAKALTTKNNPNALITTQQLNTILNISKSSDKDDKDHKDHKNDKDHKGHKGQLSDFFDAEDGILGYTCESNIAAKVYFSASEAVNKTYNNLFNNKTQYSGSLVLGFDNENIT